MNLVFYSIKFFGSIVSIYAFICVIRIFITWIPGVENSKFGFFIKQVTDPWLMLFRKFSPPSLRIDFSPIIAIGTLYIIAAVLQQIGITRSISLGIILAIIIQMLWSICSSILTIFNIMVLLRLLSQVFLWTNPFWYNLENVINPISTWIRSRLLNNRFFKPVTLTLITLACGIIIHFLGNILINLFVNIFYTMPF